MKQVTAHGLACLVAAQPAAFAGDSALSDGEIESRGLPENQSASLRS